MDGYKDPWSWMQGEQVPKMPNTLPQLPQTQAPANVGSPSMGPLTSAVQSKAINKGLSEADKALFGKTPPPNPASVPVEDAVPMPVSGPATPVSSPVQGPATGTEALQAQPLAPLAAPIEPTTAAAAQGTEIAGAAQAATEATAIAEAAAAAETAGLAVQTAGMTAAQIEAFLAAQAAQALAAQQAAAYAAVVLA
jgi:hypothetical protein